MNSKYIKNVALRNGYSSRMVDKVHHKGRFWTSSRCLFKQHENILLLNLDNTVICLVTLFGMFGIRDMCNQIKTFTKTENTSLREKINFFEF